MAGFLPLKLDGAMCGVGVLDAMDGEGEFAVLIRTPKWAVNGVHVSINGERHHVEAVPGEHVFLDRSWRSGDTIDLRMPMSFRLSRVMDQSNIASLFYGPVPNDPLFAGMDPGVVSAEHAWWFPERDDGRLYDWKGSNINMLTKNDPPYEPSLGSVNLRGISCRIYKV